MGSTFLTPHYFDADGNPVGNSAAVYLPEYLDWMPIKLKAFWFIERGYGEPTATRVLVQSQGEQRLLNITTPLQHLNYKSLQENEHGLEERCNEFARREGISRAPRNQ